MIKIILLLLYISLPLLVIFVERKNPTEALLWVIVLLCFPYFGAFLYLIFGSTISIKLTAFIRKRKLKKYIQNKKIKSLEIPENILSETDKEVGLFNYVYNESKITCYDTAKVFISGKEHYEQLFEDIKNAKECIFIEFYTIHNDIIGNKLVEVLTKKAKEGVLVLIMFDFIANLKTPNKMFKTLIKEGGKVVRLKPYLTHYRSHRKIVTVDHKISYIGGMNIGKQYANMGKKKKPWRDTQVRLEGACTSILDEFFIEDWLCAVGHKMYEKTVLDINKISVRNYHKTKNICQFVIGGVETNKESVKMSYLSMIRSAKNKICIQSPYFIPDVSILDALKTAAASGIEIKLMIPKIKASFFLDPLTTYYSGQIMQYGAKVYKYDGYIHAKTMIVDDEICCIGSVNMDMRSLMVDDEICGVFYENNFVNNYLNIFTKDMNNCEEYKFNSFINRSTKEKLLESILIPFAPIF